MMTRMSVGSDVHPSRRLVAVGNLLPIMAVLLMSASCGGPTEVDKTLVQGLVSGFEAADPDLEVTGDEARITINVTTYGDACREKGELRVAVSSEAKSIRVAPFDWLVHLEACDDILRTFRHTATVDIADRLGWKLTLVGRDIDREPLEYVVDISTLPDSSRN